MGGSDLFYLDGLAVGGGKDVPGTHGLLRNHVFASRYDEVSLDAVRLQLRNRLLGRGNKYNRSGDIFLLTSSCTTVRCSRITCDMCKHGRRVAA